MIDVYLKPGFAAILPDLKETGVKTLCRKEPSERHMAPALSGMGEGGCFRCCATYSASLSSGSPGLT